MRPPLSILVGDATSHAAVRRDEETPSPRCLDANTSPSQRNYILRRLIGEPTFHFTIVGALLFVVSIGATHLSRPIIEIDPRAVEWRIREIERGQGTTLSTEERRLAEEAYVDEQVLAREARARQLDDDERIRSLLYQKMLHILSGAAIQPTEAELRAYYDVNQTKYVRPLSATIDEIVIVGGGTGRVPEELRDAQDWENIQRASNIKHRVLQRVTEEELTWIYGAETATAVLRTRAGQWAGPHRSQEGEHWFRVNDCFDSVPPPSFDLLRQQLRFDWITDNEERLLKRRVAEIRERYSVRFSKETSD